MANYEHSVSMMGLMGFWLTPRLARSSPAVVDLDRAWWYRGLPTTDEADSDRPWYPSTSSSHIFETLQRTKRCRQQSESGFGLGRIRLNHAGRKAYHYSFVKTFENNDEALACSLEWCQLSRTSWSEALQNNTPIIMTPRDAALCHWGMARCMYEKFRVDGCITYDSAEIRCHDALLFHVNKQPYIEESFDEVYAGAADQSDELEAGVVGSVKSSEIELSRGYDAACRSWCTVWYTVTWPRALGRGNVRGAYVSFLTKYSWSLNKWNTT
eukprot:scaffold46144_cov199-Amphora_coffeaeformis.AAC.2